MKKLMSALLALTLTLTLASCGMREPTRADVDLGAFHQTLMEEQEWPAMMSLEDDLLESFYPGLLELELKQCIVSTAAISATVGELALVEVENEEDVQTVKDIFQARIDYQVGMGPAPAGLYPMTIEGWQTTAQIVSKDNCVMLAVGDCSETAVKQFEALFQ